MMRDPLFHSARAEWTLAHVACPVCLSESQACPAELSVNSAAPLSRWRQWNNLSLGRPESSADELWDPEMVT